MTTAFLKPLVILPHTLGGEVLICLGRDQRGLTRTRGGQSAYLFSLHLSDLWTSKSAMSVTAG
jgi:hypothetical protein